MRSILTRVSQRTFSLPEPVAGSGLVTDLTRSSRATASATRSTASEPKRRRTNVRATEPPAERMGVTNSDQVSSYPEERVLEIKRDHQAWAAKLGTDTGPGPMRLVPDPAHEIPKMLKLFTNGTAFWHYFAPAKSFCPVWPEGLSDDHEDMIASFFQNLEDWMDVSGMESSYSMHRDASKAMANHIKELAESGFFLGARRRYMLLTGGTDAPLTSWVVMDVEIQPAHLALLVDEDGNPLTEETVPAGQEPGE